MASVTVDSAASFSTGRVIARTFSVVGRNLPTFGVLGLLYVVPVNLWSWFYLRMVAAAGGATQPLAAFTGRMLYFTLAAYVLQISLHYLLQAALVHGTITDLNGRRASVGECFSTSLRSLFPLIAIAILASLGIGFGFVLLLVPGCILACMWVVVVPVRVVESTGILETFGRSSALTRGHRGAIFGLLVIYFIAVAALGLVVRPLTGMDLLPRTVQEPNLVFMIGNGLVGLLSAIVSATAVASIYYELRSIKEGIGAEQLAAVFA